MTIIYRISDAGYNKVKPEYINNENCLRNAIKTFSPIRSDMPINWYIIADNCSFNTQNIIKKQTGFQPGNIEYVSMGNGALTFNLALKYALTLPDDEIVYFLENDYLHKINADKILLEGFELGADYVALYDHPDKYIDGANPYVEGGGEVTRVFLSTSCHWKLTNSTTMTFATKVKTLREDESILRKWTIGTHPHDFDMFLELQSKGRSLITPIPGYATHGETAWLSPLYQWEKCIVS